MEFHFPRKHLEFEFYGSKKRQKLEIFAPIKLKVVEMLFWPIFNLGLASELKRFFTSAKSWGKIKLLIISAFVQKQKKKKKGNKRLCSKKKNLKKIITSNFYNFGAWFFKFAFSTKT